MTDCRDKIEPSADSNLPQPSRVDTLYRGCVQLEDYPELIPVVARAVADVINSNNINRERHAGLVDDAERAAAAAALTSYEQMVVSTIRALDVAREARRAQASLIAATAEGVAEGVTDAAAEVHTVEDAAADHVAWTAANAASELAALVSLDDDTAASTAAALVVKAVSEAAAINTGARADAASSVAQAAADAAADVTGETASTALAAESDVIRNALNDHQDALETCYKVAAVAAQAEITHHACADLLQRHHHPPDIEKTPA